jgi:hypothetical protein
MRTSSVVALLLAALAAFVAAAPAGTVLVVNPTAGVRQTDFVMSFTMDSNGSFLPNQIYYVEVTREWYEANPESTDIACKASKQTKVFDSNSSFFFQTSKFSNATQPGIFGVTFESEAAFVNGDIVNLICRLNMPTAPVISYPAAAYAGTIGSEDIIDATVMIPAIVATPTDRGVVAATFVIRTQKPVSFTLFVGLNLFFGMLEGNFPTKTMVSNVAFYDPVLAYNETTPADSQLTLTVRLTPSLDTTTDALESLVNSDAQRLALSQTINAEKGRVYASMTSVTTQTVSGLCYDGVREQTDDHWETDTDCGGSSCKACELQEQCDVNTDCWSGVCNKSTGRCANSASALTVSFAVVVALIAAALFGL